MGIDMSWFLDPRRAAMLSAEDRKAIGATTAGEDAEARQARAEAALQRVCERELAARGIAYLHLSPRAREKRGWPDLVFCVNGRACAVELKSATGALSPDQDAMLAQMARNGWDVRVCRAHAEFLEAIDDNNDLSGGR